MPSRLLLPCAAIAVALAAALPAGAHFDHPAPAFMPPADAPLSSELNAGGTNASWELLATIATGNPHSDLDFFTSKGEMYASAGTLGVGPNAGGQSIVRLTNGNEIAPQLVGSHPSAACPSATTSATGLQHDVEATPKGNVIFNSPTTVADRRDAQLLLDATDATGRCHDNGTLGAQSAPNGGIEIIDITDPTAPKELGLISHIGNAHTVNVDPKRPHIAFDVTQDGVAVGADGKRANEASGNALDGFEVIDLKSCMDFPAGTSLEEKRARCRPQVYRFRYPQAEWALSHTFRSNLQSCHEVEIYPDDKLACASITATLLLDLSNAFDDNGTPADFRDDKPRGTPLPCAVRDSSSAEFGTGAKITDCVNGIRDGQPQPLTVSEWLKIGSPSLEGVRRIGTVHHMGFSATQDLATAPFDATQDIVAAHESELTESGRFVLTTDERGGGVVPVSAGCSPGADNVRGNGGIHAFPVANFSTTFPKDAAEAQKAWGKTSTGERAIYRAPTRTGPQGSFCTSHVFQLIPGQNRIFMGWYSQGTQVVDFTENIDGTIDFKEAAWFTPENANTWTSAIFRVDRNDDGTFTYYGATGDGILPGSGRGAVDVYKVTLPAPPLPAGGPRAGGAPAGGGQSAPCARAAAFTAVRAAGRGRDLALSFARSGTARVQVDVLDAVSGRRVARLGRRTRAFRYRGRLRDGYYVVRFSARAPNGIVDARRVAVRRVNGRWRPLPAFERRASCDLVTAFALDRPVFGRGRARRLGISFRLAHPARVTVEVRRGARLVKRFAARAYPADGTRRLSLAARGVGRGNLRVKLVASRPGKTTSATLTARRL